MLMTFLIYNHKTYFIVLKKLKLKVSFPTKISVEKELKA
jgi:hypothetical protein